MQGFPIRMIIPGHIGGRMVKWVEEIMVTPGESDNFYHFHDNRVLPPGIDQERAKAEGADTYPSGARASVWCVQGTTRARCAGSTSCAYA